MAEYWDGDLWVCVDCYFAHHYGAHEHDGQWYAGEDDSPCDREPLGRVADCELADNTCSDHELVKIGEDEFGDDLMECPHCEGTDYESGMDDFSWSQCDGCGSYLGGARYRLAYKVLAV